MNRIAAKITQEIAMLLQNNHIDARPRQKITRHHSSGTSANDATSSAQALNRFRYLFHAHRQPLRSYAEITLF
jgi:hypothetical protein